MEKVERRGEERRGEERGGEGRGGEERRGEERGGEKRGRFQNVSRGGCRRLKNAPRMQYSLC